MSKKIYSKEIVLNAALELAKVTGFDRLSIRGIARKLNISPSPVYDSFDSKKDIVEAIIVKVLDENSSIETYFERNLGILNFGLKHPILYNDIKVYTRQFQIETTHIEDIRALMHLEPKLQHLDDRILNSYNFDILLYISGLIQLRLSDVTNEIDIDYYHSSLEAFSELLLIGYKNIPEGAY